MCRLFQIPPVKEWSSAEGRRVDNWWRSAQRTLLADRSLLQNMMSFDKDNIPEHVIRSIRPFVEDEACEPDNVRKISIACSAFAAWVRAMYSYHFVSQQAQPLRLRLEVASTEFDGRMGELEALRQRLRERADASSSFQEELLLLDRS
mmetsp:Transcript_8426/g.16706  ORF Transcript_8426/g.16706 Transcript_8426/m.16706 type:complete len:148 (-) Transcript_8426:63-506(-)